MDYLDQVRTALDAPGSYDLSQMIELIHLALREEDLPLCVALIAECLKKIDHIK